MVTVKLVGRHANQLFMIANCISYARKHGLEYHIPAHTANDAEWPPAITHLENPNYDPNLALKVVHEKQHNFYDLPFEEKWREGNIILIGYFQSVLRFENDIEEVRDAFGYDYDPKNENCCVHWRIGDYKLYPQHHPIVTPEYINLAMNLYRSLNARNSMFRFFSDSVDYCYFWLNDNNKNYNISLSREEDSKLAFQEILFCKSFIISNSTFSLMAAILSKSENKICISPHNDNWFGPMNKKLDPRDIIPDYFHKIKF